MYYGQFKTDRAISEFFEPDYIGICLDVGAARPVRNNNTYFFEQKGWTAYCIEPNKNYIPALKQSRKKVFNFACGAEDMDEVEFTICTLDGGNQEAVSSLKIDEALLEQHQQYRPKLEKVKVEKRKLDSFIKEQAIKHIDFVSIDTEGTELDVLKGFDLNKQKPKLLVIENNFEVDDIENYLGEYGYVKKRRVGVNDLYLRESNENIR